MPYMAVSFDNSFIFASILSTLEQVK